MFFHYGDFFVAQAVKFVNHLVNLFFIVSDLGLLGAILQIILKQSMVVSHKLFTCDTISVASEAERPEVRLVLFTSISLRNCDRVSRTTDCCRST